MCGVLKHRVRAPYTIYHTPNIIYHTPYATLTCVKSEALPRPGSSCSASPLLRTRPANRGDQKGLNSNTGVVHLV
ncbi:hypothetical protein EON63_15165 [archaeon]|nr:MAG: hypothetical protein EON63_15165 [archaeon]